ncbi:MAG: single-stranded DNA-binding protein [Eubacteriales bacterium]|nr:single-stranded DNA-binding protein [Eubacteriales bacterium]MDD3199577.1 single-stranded DNA-binding protein [Eubacteriales bacterium]MDD4121597.1 single-stranded DNA-binding protein [Eubacteriales bacterium]MDD4629289.1 single-stranded DNA-binding protein [Eubacteriales bacterium]
MDGIEDKGLETNRTLLNGVVLSQPVISHKSYGETFYSIYVGIDRKSGYCDIIQIIVSERLIWNLSLNISDNVKILGQIRTYNEETDGRNKLNVVVFAREFQVCNEDTKFEHENVINLEGFICKNPIGRVSPLGREICDIMLAVNRMYNKSDYIPCIAWGRNAGYASNLAIGTKISIMGRIQSREYRKRDAEGNITVKTAYEVSILKLEALI